MDVVDKTFEDIPFADENSEWNHLGLSADDDEPDTALEKKISVAIQKWFYGEGSKDDAIQLFKYKKLFQAAKEKFPDVFAPPYDEEAYRGMSITAAQRDKIIDKGYIGDEFFHDRNWMVIDKLFDYKGNKPVESWTTNPQIAINFAVRSAYEKKPVAVILETIIDDSFLFNDYFSADMMGESEVISFQRNRKVKVYILGTED